ncbi:CBS domain-containing protein [Clostridium collagenovorans DSM 3089]|uniref:CBS domain-containing protein n=1 Tax=Clostridium collagenovorans DSM 3089 TaxID=1121306 RepID=A0A1M5W063_9CLOT|nr:CBS domain-containing protein [Clostridium collagenovorans]SHH80906.1 CBS domain-containing protein [Clostridium collagenovorans DSM 3089]
MFVSNLMLGAEKLVTVSPKETVKRALDLIEENKFLSIPVAEGDKFYGTISKERIYTFYFEKSLDKKSLLEEFLVENVMRVDVPVIDPMENVEEAAHFLATKNTAFVAVIDSRKSFKGIVTHNAVFKQFTELFGLNNGRRISVIAYDIPGQISKLSKIITENNGDIISFVVIDPKSLTEVKEIVVRLKSNNYDEILDKIKNAGFKVQ